MGCSAAGQQRFSTLQDLVCYAISVEILIAGVYHNLSVKGTNLQPAMSFGSVATTDWRQAYKLTANFYLERS